MRTGNTKVPDWLVRFIVVMYVLVILILVLMAASNYPIQWRLQVNKERLRYAEVIAQALEYYMRDHHGELPAAFSFQPFLISNTDTCSALCPRIKRELPCYNLQRDLVPGYLEELPQDPLINSAINSGFYVFQLEHSFTVGACYTYFNETIHVTKQIPK